MKTKFEFSVAYANDIDALVPEWWAMESLVVLEEELVIAGLVNRDYDDEFARAGDYVHVNKPGTFAANHKVQGSDTTAQDVDSSDTLVSLNQHIETTFLLDEQEIRKADADLFEYFIKPAVRSISEGIDAAVYGQSSRFYANSAGTPGTAINDAAVIELARVFTANNNPRDGRYLVVGPQGEADLMAIDRYTEANVTGLSQGLQLTGEIGNVQGFTVLQSQSVGNPTTAGIATGSETLNGTLVKGATTMTIDAATTDQPVGTWFTIAGVPGMYRTTIIIGNVADTTSVTFEPALKGAAADGAAVTFTNSNAGVVDGAITANNSTIKIVTDGYADATEIPAVGDRVSFGSTAALATYMVTAVDGTWAANTTDITLTVDRPFIADIADGAVINVMPQGTGYNFALRPDAITLVNRPLAPVLPGTGAASINAADNGLSMRITVGYDNAKQRYRVTVDTLLGVQVLDLAQGALLYN